MFFLLVGAAASAQAQTSPICANNGTAPFDVEDDFAVEDQPCGVFSSGYTASRDVNSAFTLYPQFDKNAIAQGIDRRFRNAGDPGNVPAIFKNTTDQTVNYGVVQPADVLNVHPGLDGSRSVVRFTVPTTGVYSINGRFVGLGSATTDAQIVRRSGATNTVLFNETGAQNVVGSGTAAIALTNLNLTAGDFIDFSVGDGGNGASSDSTGLDADITRSAITRVVDDMGVDCTGSSSNAVLNTIQAAIDAASAGDTIRVCPGTYREQITINKPLTLLGGQNNDTINPNTGTRGEEAILLPTASDPNNFNTGPIVVRLAAANITFSGFTINGDNPALTSNFNVNGANPDAAYGIFGPGTTETAPSTSPANPDATITNNIVRNIGEIGIVLAGNFSDRTTPRTNSNISNNLIDNVVGLSFGSGIQIIDNAFADVTNNVVTQSFNGIEVQRYVIDATTPHPASRIGDNRFTTFGRGVFHNFHSNYTAPGFTYDSNIMNSFVETDAPDASLTSTYIGMRLESIAGEVPVTIINNTISPNRADLLADGYVRIDGIYITNVATVSPNILITENSINNTLRGIAHVAPAVPNVTCNFITNNNIGVFVGAGEQFEGTSSSNGAININNNNIRGNSQFGVQNAVPSPSPSGSPTPVATTDARMNYWNAPDGPGPVGPGSGDRVSENVDFDPFLTAPTTCTGAPPVPTPPTPVVTSASGSSTSNTPINFTVDFGEPVTGFDASDVVLTAPAGSTVTVTGSGAVYNVAVNPMNSSGTVSVSIRNAAANDLEETPSNASNTATVTFTAPSNTTCTGNTTAPFDVEPDFSTASNPCGVFSSGSTASDDVNSAFTLYPFQDTNNPTAGISRRFRDNPDSDLVPAVFKNNTDAQINYFTIQQPADLLNLHPAVDSGARSVVRFTVPATATYRIAGRFVGIDTGGTTTDVQIIRRSGANNATNTVLFDGDIAGFNDTDTFDLTSVSLTAGDTVDFSVGNNGSAGSDSTGLAATINTLPTIAANNVTQQQQAPSSRQQIATVNDNDQTEDTLSVTVRAAGATGTGSQAATQNGVTVSNIQVAANGSVTADIQAATNATTATFTLRVVDAAGNAAEATLTVTVSAETTAPTVTIADSSPSNQVGRRDSVVYTLTFSEPVTGVELRDFENAGSATVTFSDFVAVSSTVYRLTATPTTTGTLQLRIRSDAAITDSQNNALVVPVTDDDVIQVLLRRPRSSPTFPGKEAVDDEKY